MDLRLVFSNYDAPTNPYYGGGGARAIHEVARRLAARHRMRVITGAFPDSRDEVVDGVRYERMGPRWAGPKTGQLWFQFLLPGRVRRETFDVWVESLTPPFSTACLPWFTRRPVVALTQVLAGQAMGRKYRLPFGTLERWGLKTYRQGIALSSQVAAQLRHANPSMRLAVIPNGIDRREIDRPVQRDERHLLFLGRLDVQQKGLDLLLEAVHAVGDALRVPLVIAGSGPEEGWVLRRTRELGLEHRVRLVGRVDGARKEELFRQAMGLVMPSRFEASPLVMVEAFCWELPVVAFDIPDLADLPLDCSVKAPPFDAHALGRAMVELVGDAERRRRLGVAAKTFARQFDWDELARRYEVFLEEVSALVPSTGD